MKSSSIPQMLSADLIDNSVVVEFEDDPHPVIFTAYLLHAARDVAQAIHQKDQEKRGARPT